MYVAKNLLYNGHYCINFIPYCWLVEGLEYY